MNNLFQQFRNGIFKKKNVGENNYSEKIKSKVIEFINVFFLHIPLNFIYNK